LAIIAEAIILAFGFNQSCDKPLTWVFLADLAATILIFTLSIIYVVYRHAKQCSRSRNAYMFNQHTTQAEPTATIGSSSSAEKEGAAAPARKYRGSVSQQLLSAKAGTRVMLPLNDDGTESPDGELRNTPRLVPIRLKQKSSKKHIDEMDNKSEDGTGLGGSDADSSCNLWKQRYCSTIFQDVFSIAFHFSETNTLCPLLCFLLYFIRFIKVCKFIFVALWLLAHAWGIACCALVFDYGNCTTNSLLLFVSNAVFFSFSVIAIALQLIIVLRYVGDTLKST